MQAEPTPVVSLEEDVLSLVEAQSPSDIFKILLKGSQGAAPRGAIFLVRQGVVKGWGSIGYDAQTAAAQRAYSCPANQGGLGRFVENPALGIELGSGGDPDFGQAAAIDSAAIAVRVKGRTIALLVAERIHADERWHPGVLSMLVAVGQQRLELDLALRKLSKLENAEAPAVAAEAAPATPSAPVAETPAPAPAVEASTPTAEPLEIESTSQAEEPSPAPEAAAAVIEPPVETTEIEELPSPSEDAAAEEPSAEVATAQRFAKLVATDIRLYNEEAVMAGRKDGDLVDRLGDQMLRGRETFMRRHGEMGSAAQEILYRAFVEVLAAGDESLLPESALE